MNYNYHMRFVTLITLLFYSLAHLAISKNNTEQTDDYKRIYIYFSEIAISDIFFSVEGEFYTYDDKKTTLSATQIYSNGIAEHLLDNRLWYVDIPSNIQFSKFYLYYNQDLWSQTEIYKLDGCVFEYSTKNYAVIEKSSGWHSISIELSQFADYIIYGINAQSSKKTDGYEAYDEIKKGFYDSLRDYSDEKADSIKWKDNFLGLISFKQKWSILETNYLSNHIKSNSIVWPYIVGCFLLLFSSVIVLASIIWERKNEKR